MFKRLALIASLFLLCAFIRGGFNTATISFTSAWRSIQIAGGGANSVIHSYSDGSLTASGDTFGAWQSASSGNCVLDGTINAAPCWSVATTTDSMPAGTITWASSSGANNGPVEYVKAPSNLSVQYVWFQNKVYVSTNNGATFAYTDLTITYNPNGNDKNTAWIAVDPANPDIVYLVTPANSFTDHIGTHAGTLLVNTSGRTCTSSCWTAVSGIPAPSGFNGGNVVFDQTSSVVGGVTQGIYAAISGSTGVWHSTNGSTFSQANAGSPPTSVYNMVVDKFSQLWAIEGFRGTQGKIYKFTSGTWTNITISTSIALTAIFQDPNTGASSANNQMIVVDNNGQISATLNNGTDSWAHTIGLASLALQSVSPQAGWLNIANQFSGGNLSLNAGTCTIDPNGKIWCGTGIDVFTTPDPITAGSLNSTATYSANNIGMNQLVDVQVISPPGLGVFVNVWDRGIFSNLNPDIQASSQYPNNSNNCSGCKIITGGWGLDYVPGTGTLVGILGGQQGGAAIGVTTNGSTWGQTTQVPAVGVGLGGQVATSTATNWCIIPGDTFLGAGQNTIVSCTTNAGAAWSTASFTGSPAAFLAVNTIGVLGTSRYPLAADRVTAGTFYVLDINQKFFSSTNNGANFAPTGATSASTCISTSGGPGQDRLIAVPGNAGHVFYGGETGPLCKSTNGAVSFTTICPTMDRVALFGFGAPLPGGGGYPTIGAYQIDAGTLTQGFYTSVNGQLSTPTCSPMNIPSSELLWAGHVADFPQWMTGDPDIYGRWNVGVRGSTAYFIDTTDACPWIFPSNTLPTASFAIGTPVTLQAQHSGVIPITSVNFYFDGVLIGSQTTGSSSGSPSVTTYSQSWTPGGSAGSHTLKYEAVGNGCTAGGGGNAKSIPITTH